MCRALHEIGVIDPSRLDSMQRRRMSVLPREISGAHRRSEASFLPAAQKTLDDLLVAKCFWKTA
jgi:hypothetical protein